MSNKITRVWCKGMCERLNLPKKVFYGYILGGRRCTTCDKFYRHDNLHLLKDGIRCKCCGVKTTGRGSSVLERGVAAID